MKNIFAYRHYSEGHYESRFDHRSDRHRLAGLGIFIITFGTLALADNLLLMPIADPFGGVSAIFSATMIFLIIHRISGARILVDWTLNSIFLMSVGFVLYADETIEHICALVLFCAFLFASGLSRLWIGYSEEQLAAASWILCSGCIALLAALWVVSARVLQISTMPPNILALDILFQGISIVGFGLSLKKAD